MENEPAGLQITEVPDDELPIRLTLGKLQAAGKTHRDATFRLLSVGRLIPERFNHYTPPARYEEAASYLFWNYEPTDVWLKLIQMLGKDFGKPTLSDEIQDA